MLVNDDFIAQAMVNAFSGSGSAFGNSNPLDLSGARYIPEVVNSIAAASGDSAYLSNPMLQSSAQGSSGIVNRLLGKSNVVNNPSTSARSSSSGRRPSNTFNYVDAALAQQYGMDRMTAYQEALANTAHQREVQDLIAAGLNPVLSAKYGGASVFSPNGVLTASGGGGSGGSGNSGKSSKQVLDAAAGIIGSIVSLASKNSSAGRAVTGLINGTTSLLDAFSR